MLYNSDKTNFHSFILESLFSPIFCLYNERSLVYFRQITTSVEEIYQKRSSLDASKFVFIIILYVVKRKGRKLLVIFHIPH